MPVQPQPHAAFYEMTDLPSVQACPANEPTTTRSATALARIMPMILAMAVTFGGLYSNVWTKKTGLPRKKRTGVRSKRYDALCTVSLD